MAGELIAIVTSLFVTPLHVTAKLKVVATSVGKVTTPSLSIVAVEGETVQVPALLATSMKGF